MSTFEITVERKSTDRWPVVPVGGDVAATKALVSRLASAGLVVTSQSEPVVTSAAAAPTPAVVLSAAPAAPETHPG